MEFDQPQPDTGAGDVGPDTVPQLLKIQKTGMGRLTRSYRIREGDILVAIDGDLFLGDNETLKEVFKDYDPTEPDIAWLITFWRDGVFFNVCFGEPLRAQFDFVTPEEALPVLEGHKTLTFGPIENYQNYEVFKDLERNAGLHSTSQDPLATYLPLFWMLNHRLYYPMLAIGIIYAATFVTHPLVFAVAYVMTCIYVKRAQLNLLRSYALFADQFYWFVVAAQSETEAMAKCVELDPKVRFAYQKEEPTVKLNRLQRKELAERGQKPSQGT